MFKSALLPVEYESEATECSYTEQILEKVTFLKDFHHIKKGDYYHSIYISFDEGYIVLGKAEDVDEQGYYKDGTTQDVFYVQFKIINKNEN